MKRLLHLPRRASKKSPGVQSRGFVNTANVKPSPKHGLDSNVEEVHFGWRNRVLVTCEHASNNLPESYHWSDRDKENVGDTHWSYDPGAREFAIELASKIKGHYIGTRYSRLLIDCNRHVAADSLIRKATIEIDGSDTPIDLNAGVTKEEEMSRIMKYYLPYHRALANVQPPREFGLNGCEPLWARTILSIHSFNQNYGASVRDFEIGVLTTSMDSHASEICEGLVDAGFKARVNRPWSGKDGFMYAADSLRVAFAFRRAALMFEFRNDLCTDPQWRRAVQAALIPILKEEFAL